DALSEAVEALHGRLRASEKERVKAEQKLETLQNKIVRDQKRFDRDRHVFEKQIETVMARNKKLEKSIEEEKVRSIEELLISRCSDGLFKYPFSLICI